MNFQTLLHTRWRTVRAALPALGTIAFDEGRVHERVTLFAAIRFPWWRRADQRRREAMLTEARAHEETARKARLAAVDAAVAEWDAMLHDAQTALTALGTIAQGQCRDATEVAAQVLDQWRGSMARFGFVQEPAISLHIDIGVNTAEFTEGAEAVKQSIRDIAVRFGQREREGWTSNTPRDCAMPNDA